MNPATKLVIALAEAAVAFVLRGWSGPLAVLAVVLATAAVSGVGRRVLPFVLATFPLVISILLVNTFLFPGATDRIVVVGPLAPTWTGLTAALQATLRVVAFALSVAVFSLTTPTDDLLSDLESRGLGRRGVFVIGAAIRMVPRVVERASEIIDAQRARGLDTEGNPWRRIRGILPLAGPMISSALTEVEERTMALEARAFSAPGRRTTIRLVPDGVQQRVLRWAIGLAILAVVIGTVAGWLVLP
ncbi:MAG: energy-coupling factor transporter transmembrane component T [Chloroflexota bacterium]